MFPKASKFAHHFSPITSNIVCDKLRKLQVYTVGITSTLSAYQIQVFFLQRLHQVCQMTAKRFNPTPHLILQLFSSSKVSNHPPHHNFYDKKICVNNNNNESTRTGQDTYLPFIYKATFVRQTLIQFWSTRLQYISGSPFHSHKKYVMVYAIKYVRTTLIKC